MNSFQNMLTVRQSGYVKRFHTVRMHEEHLLSSHAWGVALLVDYLQPEASVNLLRAAMYHDAAELITGDVSFVTKRNHPQLRNLLHKIEEEVMTTWGVNIQLDEDEKEILKLADMSDLLLTCLDELTHGNRRIITVIDRAENYIKDTFYPAHSKFITQLLNYSANIKGRYHG